MSSQAKKQRQLLLLFIGFGCVAATFAQRLPTVPTGQLLAPRLPFAESFEILGDVDGDNVQDTREQLRQLLGQQLTSAVAPLTAAPLALLSQRQPAIVAPRSGSEAAQRFADEPESSEEESDEVENGADSDTDTDIDTDNGTVVTQDLQQEYNPYRDNFQEQNIDGSYVFGYSLPNGVRRWERGFYSNQQEGLIVEGFYTEPRHGSHGIQYELRCYRADSQGYHPLTVRYVQQLPRVRRDELPIVSCLNFNRIQR